MKKIIALALSILLGSTGYVIVDHTIEERVGVLESQVESLNGVVSSLEGKHTLVYEPIITTATNSSAQNLTTTSRKQTTSTTASLETVGAELLPFDNSYQSKYMLRCYSNGRISYISTSGSNNSNFPNYTSNNKTTTQLTYTDTFLYLTDVEAKISSSERYTEPYSYYDSDYSVIYSHYNKLKNEITITFTGNTSSDLAGKALDFDVQFWTNYDYYLSPNKVKVITDNSIDSEGNFNYSVVYEFSSPLRGYFDSYNNTTSNGLVKYRITELTVN